MQLGELCEAWVGDPPEGVVDVDDDVEAARSQDAPNLGRDRRRILEVLEEVARNDSVERVGGEAQLGDIAADVGDAVVWRRGRRRPRIRIEADQLRVRKPLGEPHRVLPGPRPASRFACRRNPRARKQPPLGRPRELDLRPQAFDLVAERAAERLRIVETARGVIARPDNTRRRNNLQSTARTQRDQRLRFRDAAIDERDVERVVHAREHDRNLEQCERPPDADARPVPERQEERRFGPPIEEPLRVELGRLLPEVGVAVQQVRADRDERSGGREVAVDHVVFERRPCRSQIGGARRSDSSITACV